MGQGKLISVLLVDEDPRVAHDIVQDFGRNAVTVIVAHTLADARAFLLDRPSNIDVVILALHLPDGRGESLLPDIEACSRQPAVIITSGFLPELQANALQYRPVAIAKPVSTGALLQIVKTVVGGYAQPVIRRFVSLFDLSKRETEATVLGPRYGHDRWRICRHYQYHYGK